MHLSEIRLYTEIRGTMLLSYAKTANFLGNYKYQESVIRDAGQARPQNTGRNLSEETPRATLMATEPSSETGCSAKVRPEPPTRTLAPTPTPRPMSPEAPTYSPANAPAGIPMVGANTAQPNTPPAEMPMLSPTML